VWDWFAGDAENTYPFLGSLLRLNFGQQKKAWDWQVEAALPVLLGLPDDAVAPGSQGQLGFGAAYYVANNRARNAALPFLKQGFLRFKNLGGNSAHSLRVGRIEFVEATETTPGNGTLAAVKRDRIAHRLIGNFGWTHVGRSLDGAQYVYNTPDHNLTIVGARPTRGVFQVDGWGELDIALLYGAYTRGVKSGGAGELRLFGIYYDDWRSVLKTDNRSLAARRGDTDQIRIATLGGNYTHVIEPSAGAIDLMVWGALQAGGWGTLSHRAGSVAVEAGYQPRALPALKPWVRAGFQHSSGDGDPNDGKHGTFFQVLPTPRWYARFPFYNQMNIQDAFAQFILRPHRAWNIRSELHWLRLTNRSDLWYQGGGAFQPWSFGYIGRPSNGARGLATYWDLSVDYQVSARVSLGGYLAMAQGKAVISSIYPRGDDARLGYIELGYRF
jgi:hypothetical protein